MRYRSLTYRYAEVSRPSAPQPLGDPWTASLAVPLAAPQWRPPFDLIETERELVLRAELAGLSEELVEVRLYPDALVIEGVRPWVAEGPGSRFLAAELRYGPFRLEITLPCPVDPQTLEARYEHGLLTVTLGRFSGGE